MKKLFIPLVFLILACTDDEGNPCIYDPTLTTDEVTDITESTATFNGVINNTSENCETPNNIEQGFVYSTEIQPTLDDNQVNVNGTSISTTIENLEPNTSYYVRTFLTNSFGEFYGDEVSFVTNELLVPDAPIITNVAAGDGEVDVTFDAPIDDGGSSITEYTATSNPGELTSTIAQAEGGTITVSGLNNGTAYTFTVTATNGVGTSEASDASNEVIPVGVPDAPTITSVAAGDGQADVTFDAPSNDGGSAITEYTANSSPGNITSTISQAEGGTITVEGLTNGTTYTFTVTATNEAGTSEASDDSNEVIPLGLPDVPTNGLVGWWSFDGNPDDVSGNFLNGNVIGSTELTSDRFGQANSAYDFDYVNASFGQQNDEIQIPYDDLLEVNNITVSVWVYPRQYFWPGNEKSYSSIISRWDVAPSQEVWGISFDSSSVKGEIVNPGGGVTNGSAKAVANTPLTLNQWSHIVMTYDQVNIKLYVNSILKATTPHNGELNVSTSGISIGERDQYNGYWYHTDGKIDDVGIWDRALTEQEVKNLY